VFLQRRLEIEVEQNVDAHPDTIPLEVRDLDRWHLRNALIDLRLRAGASWSQDSVASWMEAQAAAGAVPPKAFGRSAVTEAVTFVDELFAVARAHAGGALDADPTEVQVDIELPDGRRVRGTVPGVRQRVVLDINPSRISADQRVRAWLRAAALAAAPEADPWRVVMVGRHPDKPGALHLSIRSAEHARSVLAFADDIYWRARRGAFPATAKLTHAIHTSRDGGASEWDGRPEYSVVHDPWVRFVFGGATWEDVIALPPADDEHDAPWGTATSRLGRWAHRTWSEYDGSVDFHDRPAPEATT